MVYNRIIFEGRSYLMLEENLGLLKYNPFNAGEVNTKYYSDNSAIDAVGIAPIETLTKKTIDGKKVEEVDSKMALKMKWNLQDLYSNSDLFLRYYNYFTEVKVENKPKTQKTTTVEDFMPFVREPAFKEILQNNNLGGDSEDEPLYEATEPTDEELADALAGEGELGDEPVAPMAAEPEAEAPATEEDELNTYADMSGADDLAGFTELEPEGAVSDINELEKGKKFDQNYFFYVVFKYKMDYNHGELSKNGAFHDGSKIEILKLVSENAAGAGSRVGVTGRALEKNVPGFYNEIIRILNANYNIINEVAKRSAEEELTSPEV
jgi:hypothetical protein